MAAFFRRIGLLDLSHFLDEIFACLKMGQNDPECPDLFICPLRQGLASLPYIFTILLFLVNCYLAFPRCNFQSIFHPSSFLNYHFFCFFKPKFQNSLGHLHQSPHQGFALDPQGGGRGAYSAPLDPAAAFSPLAFSFKLNLF